MYVCAAHTINPSLFSKSLLIFLSLTAFCIWSMISLLSLNKHLQSTYVNNIIFFVYLTNIVRISFPLCVCVCEMQIFITSQKIKNNKKKVLIKQIKLKKKKTFKDSSSRLNWLLRYKSVLYIYGSANLWHTHGSRARVCV